MSETYARGGEEETAAGGVIVMAFSALAAILVIAGLIYAMGASGRNKAALAAAGCEPTLSHSGLQCTTEAMLSSQYMGIMTPAMKQQNTDEAAYTASEGHNLAAAEAVLTAEVTNEHAFDTGLAGITFPPAMAPIAKALLQANQARAALTADQAGSSSLTKLRSFNTRVAAASATVQTDMNLLSKAVDTPPTAG